MKSIEEIGDITQCCLDVINEHDCHPVEAYAITDMIRFSIGKQMGDIADKIIAEEKVKVK
ncbi:MAG: hypothetical protein U9P49_04305 [Thermodesulfobacteriota bacterium]|nr:hypothetical protein [Thermodesulfobacteriota bacterium]